MSIVQDWPIQLVPEKWVPTVASSRTRADFYNHTLAVRFNSSAKVFPHADGSLQTYLNHPATHLHKLPDSCSFEAAALVEPLSVVLHAARRAHIAAGHTVLILGAGAVGLLALAIAKAHGATHTVVVDM